jgi:predicted nuclease of predicted toxin-antitoxin system
VRFVVDENLSPLVAALLTAAGHDCIHVRDVGMTTAPDRIILDWAGTEGRTVISADTDFGRLLPASGASGPSVVLLRRETDRRATSQARLLLANLDQVEADLRSGAIVVIENTRMRVRPLRVIPEPRQ